MNKQESLLFNFMSLKNFIFKFHLYLKKKVFNSLKFGSEMSLI